MIIQKILTILPTTLNHFRTVWEITPKCDKNIHTLIERIQKEIRLIENTTEIPANINEVFKSDERKCFICNKIGHIARFCNNKQCAICNKNGHTSIECFSTKTCKKCNKKGHIEKFCRMFTMVSEQIDNEISIKAIIDSGASSHMFNDYNIIHFTEKINTEIRCANAGNLVAQAIGTINTNTFDLQKVLYVPEISRNLISVSSITDHGGSVLFAGNKASDDKMVAASKLASSDDDGGGILSLIYRFFKKVSMVGAVYLVGYMQWSVAWLITPVILSVLRDQWRRESEYRRSLAKATASSSEKDVVLARIDDLPAWVFFPDIERAEWLNRILLQVWPNVNHFARSLIKDTIEPAVAENLSNFKLNGFKFERMILGTIAPRIGGVKVYDKNLSRDEIIMDVDLFYAGDCDISFVLQGIRGGIKDLQIHGMVRVVMRPLITKMPLVGGLQVFFLNNPSIDFNLVGAADVLDLPGFSDILRRCIVEQVAKMMVLPNKLPIKLSDEIPTVDLRMPEPEGVLRIHLVQAQNLMKKDISMLGKGKSDPYAIITVGAQQWKTKHIDNNVNPRWEYWCEARIMQSLGQMLEIEVFDKDEGNDDDKLGRCSLDISQVVRAGRVDTWQTLEQAKHGKVNLRLSWHRLSSNASDLSQAIMETQLIKKAELSTAVLSVYIDSCKKLPNARSTSRPDPYLTVTVGKKTENTAVQMRTDDPVYEIGYSFLVANPQVDNLEIKVLDQKTGNQLGQLTYAIASLLKQRDLSMITQPLMLMKSGPESKIVISLQLKILKEAIKEAEYEEEPPVTPKEPAPPAPRPSADAPDSAPAPLVDNNTPSAPTDLQNIDDGVADLSQDSVPVEQIVKSTDTALESEPPSSVPDTPKLVHRTSSITTSAGEAGLGRILLSVRYSMQNQTLYVVVHKIMNIPLKDPTNVPDPYVKLYLLPGRSKDSKRKTVVVKDNCMPEYDEQFEWAIPLAELHSRQLEVTVATHKGFLAGSPVIGQVVVHLNQHDFREAKTLWLDLLPETARE